MAVWRNFEEIVVSLAHLRAPKASQQQLKGVTVLAFNEAPASICKLRSSSSACSCWYGTRTLTSARTVIAIARSFKYD